MDTHHIPFEALALVLASARMRRNNAGRTCLLAALTAAPLYPLNCDSRFSHTPQARETARKLGRCTSTGPMQRGDISALYQRVRSHHGLAEVRKTWGAGLKQLLAEPAHVLNGGRTEQPTHNTREGAPA